MIDVLNTTRSDAVFYPEIFYRALEAWYIATPNFQFEHIHVQVCMHVHYDVYYCEEHCKPLCLSVVVAED